MSQQAASDSNHLNRRWRPALMSFFLRRVRNHAEAEDLTQEVFARLLTDGGRPSQSPDSYIFQVAMNLLRDGARRSKVRMEYLRDAVLLDEQDAERLDPSRVVAARDALGAFITGLDALPERTRSIFILYRIENLELDTIARSFGISKSAVKKHVMKAMAMLMAQVRDFR
ncbi:RNA polymerase sigma factor [Peristeroidobacter soli]|uniref:RNA polymerase sigma factor n=1 Tax=Peristeroidobacter soli TaxID=2497877 RepID=UPI001C37D4FE|nr:RNA polymerase sigma factor [Peristeroidobacter soli]